MRIRDLLGVRRRRSRSVPTQIADDQRDSTARQSVADLFNDLVKQAVASGADNEKIRTALDHATQAAAEAFAENLRSDAPRMLGEHARIQKGFEHRLYLRWRRALDLFEVVRTCCLEAGENFYMDHRSEIDPKLSALTLLHARACLVASEVQGLLGTGHAAGAQARWRTLHELAVIAFLLSHMSPGGVARTRNGGWCGWVAGWGRCRLVAGRIWLSAGSRWGRAGDWGGLPVTEAGLNLALESARSLAPGS